MTDKEFAVGSLKSYFDSVDGDRVKKRAKHISSCLGELEKLREQLSWKYPSNNELPTEGQRVLLCLKPYGVYVSAMYWRGRNEESCFVGSSKCYELSDVYAWMPAPDLPENVKGA